MCASSTLFNTCMDHGLGKMSEKSGCGLSFETVRITDIDYAENAVIFAVTTEVLSEALELLSEDSKPLGLRDPCIEMKMQADRSWY